MWWGARAAIEPLEPLEPLTAPHLASQSVRQVRARLEMAPHSLVLKHLGTRLETPPDSSCPTPSCLLSRSLHLPPLIIYFPPLIINVAACMMAAHMMIVPALLDLLSLSLSL